MKNDRKGTFCIGSAVILLALLLATPISVTFAKTYTLNECIDRALGTNLSVVQAQGSLRQAKSDVLYSWGQYLPSIGWQMRGTYNHLRLSRVYDEDTRQFFEVDYTRDSHSYRAVLWGRLTLFDGLTRYHDYASSKAYRSEREHRLTQTQIQAAFGVKTDYFNLLKAQSIFDIRRKATERSHQLMKIAQTKYELGSASLSDVLKAKVSLSQAQLDSLTAENAVATGQAKLAYAVGENVNEAIVVTEVDLSVAIYSIEQVNDMAIRQNPDYLASQESLRAASHGLSSARGAYYPSVSLDAGKSWDGLELGQLDEWWADNYLIYANATLDFNIFNRFGTKRQTEYAKANLHTAEYTLSDTKRAVELEVREAYLNLQEKAKARELANERLASAAEDYKLAQEKYTLGAATILDILDAEVSLKTAESDKIDSKYNYYLAVARLQQVMGIIE
ncbi:MAG: TolC family protein [Candidatus Zixiibacteriota bacterium]